MAFEGDETLRTYVEESLERLSSVEEDLLSIKKFSAKTGGAGVDEYFAGNVFRAAHSVKGGASFLGLSVIKDLSRNLENLLNLICSGELIPNLEVVSVLMESFDQLKELINNVDNSNDVDISSYIEKIINVADKSTQGNARETFEATVDIKIPGGNIFANVSQMSINQVQSEGKYIYYLEYDLIKDIQEREKTPFDVLNSLEKSGFIIDARVDIATVGTLNDSAASLRIPFQVLYATIIENDMMPTLTDVESQYIHFLKDIPVQALAETTDVKPTTPSSPPEPVSTVPVAPIAQPVVAPSSPAPVKESAPPPPKAKKAKEAKTQTFLRVNIDLLDTLMTLAGELVLSRNQLIQSISGKNKRTTEAAGARIDMITSELQEAIMQTRMQPVSNIFNKFTRVVRDLAQTLGKEIDLVMEGKEVELDKTIIESINDPLTHLVRNSVDHGIELPQDREATGKPQLGTVQLKAYHEAGQVNIEIIDDGKGMDGDQLAVAAIGKGLITEQQADAMSDNEKLSIIFLPGFSTAPAITDVSGRGVGMDVVKTNLDQLGGVVDIISNVGKGTTIRIKLPLTLAIIPSQTITVGDDKYAIPQVNLDELLRIPAAQVQNRIEKVGAASVVRLRGALLPLVNLSEILGIQRKYADSDGGEIQDDRREDIANRRSRQLVLPNGVLKNDVTEEIKKRDETNDRRYRAASAMNLAVVSAANFKYGLIVDRLHDSEEIVVKPLGRHLKDCEGYAGATIMGDGKVALILDVASIARKAELSDLHTVSDIETTLKEQEELEAKKDRASLLLFRNAEDEQFAAPLHLVERIERFDVKKIEEHGDRKVVQYRDGSLPILELSQIASIKPLPDREKREVIVFTVAGREIGLMATSPIDAIEATLNIDDSTLKQPGIMGSTIINKTTTLMVDIFEVVKTLNPDWFQNTDLEQTFENDDKKPVKILFAEDSSFFRHQVTGFLEEAGYNVVPTEDGAEAWDKLVELGPEIDIVVTDLEMPNMDGFELTTKIKGDSKFSHLKVIALTSLAGEKDIAKGKKVGIDDYKIKLDREELLKALIKHCK